MTIKNNNYFCKILHFCRNLKNFQCKTFKFNSTLGVSQLKKVDCKSLIHLFRNKLNQFYVMLNNYSLYQVIKIGRSCHSESFDKYPDPNLIQRSFCLQCLISCYSVWRNLRRRFDFNFLSGQNGKYLHFHDDGLSSDAESSQGFFLELRDPTRICIKSVQVTVNIN